MNHGPDEDNTQELVYLFRDVFNGRSTIHLTICNVNQLYLFLYLWITILQNTHLQVDRLLLGLNHLLERLDTSLLLLLVEYCKSSILNGSERNLYSQKMNFYCPNEHIVIKFMCENYHFKQLVAWYLNNLISRPVHQTNNKHQVKVLHAR